MKKKKKKKKKRDELIFFTQEEEEEEEEREGNLRRRGKERRKKRPKAQKPKTLRFVLSPEHFDEKTRREKNSKKKNRVLFSSLQHTQRVLLFFFHIHTQEREHQSTENKNTKND